MGKWSKLSKAEKATIAAMAAIAAASVAILVALAVPASWNEGEAGANTIALAANAMKAMVFTSAMLASLLYFSARDRIKGKCALCKKSIGKGEPTVKLRKGEEKYTVHESCARELMLSNQKKKRKEIRK